MANRLDVSDNTIISCDEESVINNHKKGWVIGVGYTWCCRANYNVRNKTVARKKIYNQVSVRNVDY